MWIITFCFSPLCNEREMWVLLLSRVGTSVLSSHRCLSPSLPIYFFFLSFLLISTFSGFVLQKSRFKIGVPPYWSVQNSLWSARREQFLLGIHTLLGMHKCTWTEGQRLVAGPKRENKLIENWGKKCFAYTRAAATVRLRLRHYFLGKWKNKCS